MCELEGGQWNGEGMQGIDLAKVSELKYLRSTVQSNKRCERMVKKRVQAEWSE